MVDSNMDAIAGGFSMCIRELGAGVNLRDWFKIAKKSDYGEIK